MLLALGLALIFCRCGYTFVQGGTPAPDHRTCVTIWPFEENTPISLARTIEAELRLALAAEGVPQCADSATKATTDRFALRGTLLSADTDLAGATGSALASAYFSRLRLALVLQPHQAPNEHPKTKRFVLSADDSFLSLPGEPALRTERERANIHRRLAKELAANAAVVVHTALLPPDPQPQRSANAPAP